RSGGTARVAAGGRAGAARGGRVALLEPCVRAPRASGGAMRGEAVPRARRGAAAAPAWAGPDDLGLRPAARPSVLRRAVLGLGAARAGARSRRQGRRVWALQHRRGSRALGL